MKPIGITLGWDLKPHLLFDNGNILWGDSDRILFPEYFNDDGTIKWELFDWTEQLVITHYNLFDLYYTLCRESQTLNLHDNINDVTILL